MSVQKAAFFIFFGPAGQVCFGNRDRRQIALFNAYGRRLQTRFGWCEVARKLCTALDLTRGNDAGSVQHSVHVDYVESFEQNMHRTKLQRSAMASNDSIEIAL
jgi:hypothetical protein